MKLLISSLLENEVISKAIIKGTIKWEFLFDGCGFSDIVQKSLKLPKQLLTNAPFNML